MKTKILLLVLGTIAVLSAPYFAIVSEIGINGCCGSGTTGYEGVGYIIGGAIALLGILLIKVGIKRPSN
ncbi:MAG TPA: hypothetical protein VLG13_00160 [Patescibacteria group bacterium]|nr:hypothetical protein [Patescibacteria group bacterium]